MPTHTLISTAHALIGKKIGDNLYRVVGCHWDGHPSYMSKTLINHYNTEEKVDRLLNLGDISILREKLAPPDGAEHNFEKPYDNKTTIAYCRDESEEWEHYQPRELTFDVLINKDRYYTYVFENGKWYVCEDSDTKILLSKYKNELENIEENSLKKFITSICDINATSGVPESVYVIEECSELIKELTKKERGKGDDTKIFDEACDVLATIFVLLYQLESTESKVKEQIISKYERCINRFQTNNEI